jgi:DNA sulfur modification protein DndB
MSSHTFPVLRGTMGSTEYFQANVTAKDLAMMAKTAAELEAWKEWSIFERFQRELSTNRIKTEIVPYLTRTEDRFFGAFIVLVYEPDLFEFEPAELKSDLRGAAYVEAGQRMGFLTVGGGNLVALDGQHRLVSVQTVLTAGNEVTGPFRDDLLNDDFCVLFVKHETFEKTRRIFNKVNRYAKPVSKSDNILTSEDDGYAIVTRWLVESEPPLGLEGPNPPLSALGTSGEPIVEWRRGQLTANDHDKLTTLNHLYQSVKIILDANGMGHFGAKHRPNRPDDSELQKAYQAAATWWTDVIAGLLPLQHACRNPSGIKGKRRNEGENAALFLPVVQVALFKALIKVVSDGKLERSEAINRASEINWRRRGAAAPLRHILVGPQGNPRTSAASASAGAELIEYLIAGHEMTSPEIESIENKLKDVAEVPGYTMPQAINPEPPQDHDLTQSAEDGAEPTSQAPTDGTPTESQWFIANSNPNTKDFHLDSCTLTRDIPSNSMRYYSSRDQAIAEKKRPCSWCKP